MPDYQKQFERFQSDVAGHVVTVLRDDGLYRHLFCSRGGVYAYSFNVITWPGYLCYAGDMGCFVFSRLSDMFEFFRGRQEAMVDRQYLAEKAVAGDKPDGITAYSEDLFRAAVASDFAAYTEDFTDDERAALWEEVKDDVLSAASDGRSAAVDAAMAFRHGKHHVFTDFWDHRLEEYTARFWWSCYAIPWAIGRYDEARVAKDSAGKVAPVEPVCGGVESKELDLRARRGERS